MPKCPSLKNLTDGKFGVLRENQDAAVQDLTKAHIESFDQAVTDGLNRVVQVSSTFYFATQNLLPYLFYLFFAIYL